MAHSFKANINDGAKPFRALYTRKGMQCVLKAARNCKKKKKKKGKKSTFTKFHLSDGLFIEKCGEHQV